MLIWHRKHKQDMAQQGSWGRAEGSGREWLRQEVRYTRRGTRGQAGRGYWGPGVVKGKPGRVELGGCQGAVHAHPSTVFQQHFPDLQLQPVTLQYAIRLFEVKSINTPGCFLMVGLYITILIGSAWVQHTSESMHYLPLANQDW